MNERIKTIKGLISGQVDMGTFGLVELELIALEEEFIQAYSQTPVSGLACKCGNKTFKHIHSNWIECTACYKINVLQA
jgi:hypothetical protein